MYRQLRSVGVLSSALAPAVGSKIRSYHCLASSNLRLALRWLAISHGMCRNSSRKYSPYEPPKSRWVVLSVGGRSWTWS